MRVTVWVAGSYWADLSRTDFTVNLVFESIPKKPPVHDVGYHQDITG